MTRTLHARSLISRGVSVIALTCGASLFITPPALAQSQTPPAATAQDGGSEVIVVTATGRLARIQDVPIAITAVGAEAVKNADITDLKVLQAIVPTYHIQEAQSNAAGAAASIRGIGTGGDNPGFESAVGFFIDGVYRNRTGVALSELPEVDRIEVLAGPQGTLFGRNTSAGAISVTTKAPEFAERGFLDLTVGNYNDHKATFGFTGPLDANHVLAGKIDGNYEQRDGYITDIVSGRKLNNRDRWNLRGQLLWDINANATLRVIADTAHTDEQCCSAVSAVYGQTAAAVTGIARLGGGIGLITPPDPSAYQTTLSPGTDLLEKVDEYGLSGQLDWKVNGINVTAISSYRDWKVIRDQDIDFSDLDRAYREGYSDQFKTFTEEVRFQGVHGPLNWLVGAFYADETLDHIDNIKLGSEAAEYVDALAAGAAPGFNVFGSLGSSGCGAAQALFPTCRLLASALYQGLPNPALLPAYNAFANAVAATAPTAGQGQNGDEFQTHTRSAALFTHNEITLTHDLTWTLGARLNHEDKDMTANLPATTGGGACSVYQNTTPLFPGGPSFNTFAQGLLASPVGEFLALNCNPEVNSIANGAYASSSSENALTGVTALRYKPTEHVMVYGSYSRGYKAGGYNLDRGGFLITPATTSQPLASQLHFNPEYTDAYEIGVKSTLLGGAATLDADVFYETISDFQDNAFSGFVFLTKNVKQVVSRGVEANASFRPAAGLTLQAGALYNEAYVATTTDFNTPGLPSSPGNIIAAGTVLPSAARWTLTGALTYKRPIPQTNLQGLIYLDAHYSSGYTTATLDPIPQTNQGAFTIVNGRIGVGPERGPWAIELFARNLFNQFYYAYAFTVPEQDNHDVYPGEPRMFGATLKLTF
jgi:iron complex outermembrane receptor protein